MIRSAVNFFPRGISCPPLVYTTRDPLSQSGDVEGGQVKTAPPEKRPVLENTERNRNRPGVIRTHDQGIMSGDEPEE